MSSRGVRWLRRKSVQHWLERATGVVLVGVGVRLATEADLTRTGARTLRRLLEANVNLEGFSLARIFGDEF